MNKSTTSNPTIPETIVEAPLTDVSTPPTVEAVADPTPAPPAVPAPKSLIPRIKFNQLVKLTEAECIERNLPSTSKAKHRLGIENDREISWAPVNFDVPTHATIRGFCKKHSLAIDEFLASVAMTWIEDNREALELEAAAHIAQVHTAESAQKKMESLQRQLAAAMKLLSSLTPATEETTPPTE